MSKPQSKCECHGGEFCVGVDEVVVGPAPEWFGMASSCCSSCCYWTGTGTVVGTRRTCLNGDCWWGPYSTCYHHQQHFLHDYYYYHFVVVVVVIPLWS